MGSAWIATTLIVPHTRTTSVMRRTAAALPVTSNATSAPSPPVRSLTARTRSRPPAAGSGRNTSSPRLLSKSTRNGFTSDTRTRAPRCRETVVERVGHLDQPRRRHRPVILHAARHVHAEDLEAVADVGRAHPARAAFAAEPERLDDHAVARSEPAGRGRLGDLGEGLVADDAALRHAVVEMALIDVQIGAADADAPDAEQ